MEQYVATTLLKSPTLLTPLAKQLVNIRSEQCCRCSVLSGVSV